MYYIGRGASDDWTGFSGDHAAKGTEADKACHLIKSGTDFRDLTSATLTLSPSTDPAAIRKRTISSLKGEHLYVTPSMPASKEFTDLISSLLSSVSETLSKPVCFALTPFDARSELVRTAETGLGNWVADVLLHAYAESGIEGKGGFVQKPKDGQQGGADDASKAMTATLGTDTGKDESAREDHDADIVLLCGGTLRGDSQYGPGKITLGDILGALLYSFSLQSRAEGIEILPFEDPVVCIEVSFTVAEIVLRAY
jgi:5'-nucleotidase